MDALNEIKWKYLLCREKLHFHTCIFHPQINFLLPYLKLKGGNAPCLHMCKHRREEMFLVCTCANKKIFK